MNIIDKAKQLGISHFTVHDFVNEIDALRQQVAKLEPAWLTDIVGYGYFVDGKLTHCSPTKMQIQIGSKIIECRPLYSVKEE